MFALIQSENHASNKGQTVGRFQFDTQPIGIGLKRSPILFLSIPLIHRLLIIAKKYQFSSPKSGRNCCKIGGGGGFSIFGDSSHLL